MSGRNTRSRRGQDSPEEHQEVEGAVEANPNEEEELELALDKAGQVDKLECEPVVPAMADDNGMIDAINNGIAEITAAIAQAANNIQQPHKCRLVPFPTPHFKPIKVMSWIIHPEIFINTMNSPPSHCSLTWKNSMWNQTISMVDGPGNVWEQ